MRTEPVAPPAPLNVQKVLELAKSVHTPIQLASVALAFVFLVILFRATVGLEAIELVLCLLPFIFIFVLFSGNTLEKIKTAGRVISVAVLLIVVGSFVPPVLIASGALSASQKGLADDHGSVLTVGTRRRKAEAARNSNIRAQSEWDAYALTSEFYKRDLDEIFRPNGIGDPYAELTSLRNSMDESESKILSAKANTFTDVYGSDKDLKQVVIKINRCNLDLSSMRFLGQVIDRVYGEEGETKRLDQIIDLKGVSVDPDLQESIPEVRYSAIESDLIAATGVSFVTKPVNGFDESDVDRIRQVFSSLGYLGEASQGRSSAEILRRYQLSLQKYLPERVQKLKMYELAKLGIRPQLGIYLALYDTGLLDFRKFILKYAPEKTRPVTAALLDRPITLLSRTDVDTFTSALLQEQKSADTNLASSHVILFKIRDGFNAIFSASTADDALRSHTAEEFFVRSLKASLDLQTPANARDSFATLDYLDISEQPGRYEELTKDMLSYYNMFESAVIANVLAN